jgi:uncharacterized protein (TIGR03546 family)
MIGQIAKLLAALNSESSPRQLAIAIALGMVVGLTPTLSIHNAVILLLVFVLRINISAFFLFSVVFGGLGLLTAAPFAAIGESMLNDPGLAELWTGMYQITLFKLAHLHHTLTLGSLVASMVLLLPMYFISQWLIVNYRVHFQAFINKFKVVQALKSSRLYQMYQSYNS